MTRSESFKHFLSCFSKEKFPITFSEENITYFSSKNKPLPAELIRRFIMQGEQEVHDDEDVTEYIACCIVPDTKDFHAVVYWRAELLKYDYLLATFDKNGVLISKKVISGIRSDGTNVQKSIAIMDEEWTIDIIAGEQSKNDELYDPLNSRPMAMELLANGEIIFSLQD